MPTARPTNQERTATASRTAALAEATGSRPSSQDGSHTVNTTKNDTIPTLLNHADLQLIMTVLWLATKRPHHFTKSGEHTLMGFAVAAIGYTVGTLPNSMWFLEKCRDTSWFPPYQWRATWCGWKTKGFRPSSVPGPLTARRRLCTAPPRPSIAQSKYPLVVYAGSMTLPVPRA